MIPIFKILLKEIIIIIIIGLTFVWSVNGKQLIVHENTNITTNGTLHTTSSINTIIDGRVGAAESCNCCAILDRPSWLQLNLGRPYFLQEIEIFGNYDGYIWQFENVIIEFGLSVERLARLASYELTRNETGEIQIKRPPYDAVQFIRIVGPYQSTNHTSMTLCEIKLYQQTEINIITQNMSTSQSETYYNCSANNAINGLYHLTFDFDEIVLCHICSASMGYERYPWWQVDLGETVMAHSVRVHGRFEPHAEQSANLQVFISNMTHDFTNGTFVGTIAESGIVNGSVLFFNLRIFKYLTILRRMPSVMVLCEVEIYHAECPFGQHGMLCRPCSHCKDSICDAIFGSCTNGCGPGWKTSLCTNECDDGKYGINCTNTCSPSCIDPSSCNKVNGTCNGGCRPGYQYLKDTTCMSECSDRTYGLNCSETCSPYCIDPSSCNTLNGTCNGGCRPGYDYLKDSSCNLECSYGWYGLNCTHQCSPYCIDPSSCKKQNGTCNGGCRLGYDYLMDPTCMSECSDRTYGLNCSETCSPYCIDPSSCNTLNGTCNGGCRPGYDYLKDSSCNLECSYGWYGLNCTHKCSPYCIDPSSCNKQNGTCNGGCRPGYDYLMDPTCMSECVDSTYGLNCTKSCSPNCADARSCNKVNGTCNGGCRPGYDFFTDLTCMSECDDGNYGLHFSHNCSQYCSGIHSCNKQDGSCIRGCLPGFDFSKDATCFSACDAGKYGINCSHSCSPYCAEPRSCNKMNGTCIGGCRHGYDYLKDSSCNSACELGYFGLNCTSPCHCKEGLQCDHVSGICSVPKCLPGWTGKNCSIKQVTQPSSNYHAMTSLPTFSRTTTTEATSHQIHAPFSAISSTQDKYIQLLLIVISVISTILVLFMAGVILYCIVRTKRTKKRSSAHLENKTKSTNLSSTSGNEYDDLSTTARASDNYEHLQMRTHLRHT
ncbi:multiple epidermal growth factor-like domains protein 11 isoform X4 [Dreissena polymorpha]|uniref:multiple epidermal growth factor-like domains protein 11 isoform X3 n=1 Tax=Dreissena polymorpha TaxID=45954 RepID=UPI0022655B24|nr:multiple epidermal growth factor-like domains protein 11 isoform X3 [Dreissena polymorpha]XP_052280357.1 multiple epidermal growth factor-like domains protein 11 isoform X4 [Dreissena polymorpha]